MHMYKDWHTVDEYIRDWLDELADGEDEGAHILAYYYYYYYE